ncbi:MAG: ABC transporter ATP-binding protein [Christensenellales bacterium]
MDDVIQIQGLEKSYKDVHAVRGVDFYVERGKLFALLGPNGAGKSTIINMICTFLKPDAGVVQVDGALLGRDDDAIRRKIGVVFQEGLLDRKLTAEENLMIRGSLYGLSGEPLRQSVRKAAEAAGIMDFFKRPYGKLSGGQRRRVDIARALTHTPEILFLDEPTTGLDPQTRKNVWDTVNRLQKEEGMTLFLTTHYMEEAAEADYVIVIDEGQIAARGTPLQLKERFTCDKLILVPTDHEAARHALDARQTPYTDRADHLEVALKDAFQALPLIEALRPSLRDFEVLSGTMDDAFIAITGKEIRS